MSSPSMLSCVTGRSFENLSPDRALQKVRELVTNSVDTLSKVLYRVNSVVQNWADTFNLLTRVALIWQVTNRTAFDSSLSWSFHI